MGAGSADSGMVFVLKAQIILSAFGKVVLVPAAAAARRHRTASAAVPAAVAAAVLAVKAALALSMVILIAVTVASPEKATPKAESETLTKIRKVLTRPAARAAMAVTWAHKVTTASSS